MDKAYSRINWQNQPSTSTALGATNLNKMDVAVNTIDNRVVAMDTSKADVATVNTMVKNVTFEASTGKITVLYQNGTSSVIDTAMEKIVTNFSYNSTTQKIDLTLADGTTQSIDISDFVTNVDFANSDTVQFSVDGNGKTKADVINGSITAEKLQTDYLADITVQSQVATAQANKAQRYAVGGVESGDTTDNAQYYCQQAQIAAEQAQEATGFTIDDTPTAGSSNPVSSGGVSSALNQKANKTDIPTSLPANGGNADTVGGKSISQIALKSEIPTTLPANGGNSATVNGYSVTVVSALPTTQVSNTIYFVKKS